MIRYTGPGPRPWKRNEDRISNMPDSVLHHILCFLDMKQVITTRRLSKRWNPLWRSVPVLNFDFLFFENLKYSPTMSTLIPSEARLTKFTRFIDKVLLNRPKDSDIQGFSLFCRNLSDSDIEDWMKFMLERHVQEIDVYYVPLKGKSKGIRKMKRSLLNDMFTSGIKVVKLHTDLSVEIPPSINLANQLQTLELRGSTLLTTNQYGEVEIKCPVLENLILKNCRYCGNLNICAPHLENLVLEHEASDVNPWCCLKIYTPVLRSLVLKGILFKDISLANLRSLVIAEIELDEPVYARDLIDLLNGLSNATTLTLSAETVVSLYAVDQCPVPFHNLRRLKLFEFLDGWCVDIVHNVLASSPSIEILDLGIHHIMSKAKDVTELFQCFSGLKSMKIHGIQGGESEIDFLEFVLKTAGVLETLTVTTDEVFLQKSLEEQADFIMKIYSLPRASSRVKILVRPIVHMPPQPQPQSYPPSAPLRSNGLPVLDFY